MEDVMSDMSSSNMVLESIDDGWVISINGSKGSLQPVPAGGIIMWNSSFSMLEISDHSKVSIDDKVWSSKESHDVDE